jgi:hypothetical protein
MVCKSWNMAAPCEGFVQENQLNLAVCAMTVGLCVQLEVIPAKAH